MNRLLLGSLVCAAGLLAGCPPPLDDDDTTEDVPCDNDGAPEIAVQFVDGGQPVDFAVQVFAQFTDGDGVRAPQLSYRTTGEEVFIRTFMVEMPDLGDGVWMAEIPGSVVQSPGVDYYLQVGDGATRCPEQSWAPAAAEDESEWFEFTTQFEILPIPLYEDFEATGCADAELDDLGWGLSIQRFPQGIHAWRLSPNSALSGDCNVEHGEGIPGGFWECPPPDGAGTIERRNWLISPPLDFRTKEEVAVRWFERWVPSGICAERHRLYVSTTSPEPTEDPDNELNPYQLIADLPFPDAAWAGSEWYDLSEFAGEEKVYVALYYEGGSAGRWQIDDLYVGAPLADLVLDSAGPLDPSVGPGATGIELDVSIANISEQYGAGPLTATLTTSDPHLALTTATSTFPPVGIGEVVSLDGGPFVFNVQSTHVDNAWLDFAMILDDGAGHSWIVPIRLLLGQQSWAQIGWFTEAATTSLQLELGHGLPQAPDYSVSVDTADLEVSIWEVDITEEALFLPPGPGLDRWYLRATHVGDPLEARVDSFDITVDGTVYSFDPSDLPVGVPPSESTLLFLPPRPALTVISWESTPTDAAPGQSLTLSNVTLRNDGAPTTNPVACTMGSANPDATGFPVGAITYGSDPIPTGGTAVADADYTFDIAAGHVDNSPIAITMLCTDFADTVAVTFELPVPYAHPVTESLRIDDSPPGGDFNGLLDANEIASVYVTVRNEGAFDTAGPVTATVTQGVGSTVSSFTLSAEALEFGAGPLAAGDGAESSNALEIAVGDALLGDRIVLDVSYAAGTDVWTEELVIEVTGLPWLPCPFADDPEGDVQGTGSFDIKNCAYRSDDTLLQVRLDSYVPFDPTDVLFVDFIFYEVPNLYTIESVGGGADFEDGCVFGDDVEPVVPVSVDVSSGNSAIARVAVEDLNIIGANNTQVAFGAGSCPDIWFCDSYPGTSLFFNIEAGQYNCDGNSFIPINW